MYAQSLQLNALPEWQQHRHRRMALSLLLATVIVFLLLASLRFPAFLTLITAPEIIVRLLQQERQPEPPQPVTSEAVEPAEIAPPRAPAATTEHVPPTDTEQRPAVDWYAAAEEVIRNWSGAADVAPSMTPGFDARIREAALRYAPARSSKPRPIWEDVGTDIMGRRVLWDGNCYRVLDDPNVGSREAFLMFHQFMVTCINPGSEGRELEWVPDLRERYDYLSGS